MPVLVRRRIEAMVLGPMIRAFQDKFGEQEVNKVAQNVIEEIAQDQGAAMAKKVGAKDLSICRILASSSRAGATSTSPPASTRT
jgi:hypothetical protein